MRKPANWQSFALPSAIETRNFLTHDTDADIALAQELWDTSTGLGGLLTARAQGTHAIQKPRGERDYVYDPVTGQYRDMVTGRLVSPQVMRKAVMRMSIEAQKRLREQTRQMMAGTIMFMVWYFRSRSILKALYKTVWALAIGGFLFDDTLQRDLFYAFLLMQFQRFDNFTTYLDNQPMFDGHILARAGAYGMHGNALAQNIKLDHGIAIGHDEARRLLGENEDHCTDSADRPGCVEEAMKNWLPIRQVLPIGSATCFDSCHCVIETRRRPE
jgi:hypothetical protein